LYPVTHAWAESSGNRRGTAKSERVGLFEANRNLSAMENDKFNSVTSEGSVRSTDE
jgi:hypothetical protein